MDYRYMPDPDLGPVIISEDLVERLKTSTGVLPNTAIDELVNDYGLSETDAVALSLLENGGRAQFYYDVVDALEQRYNERARARTGNRLPAVASSTVCSLLTGSCTCWEASRPSGTPGAIWR